MREIYIVFRSDGYIAGVFSSSGAASNFCVRCSEKNRYYSYSWESFGVDTGDGLDTSTV